MPRPLRFLLRSGLILIVISLSALILLPILYKDQITAYAKNQINQQIRGKIEFQDLNLSLFTHFPKWSLNMDSVSVNSYVMEDSSMLFAARQFSLTCSFWDLINYKQGVKIIGFYLDKPMINIQVDSNGIANYQLSKSTASTIPDTSSAASNLDIEKFEIQQGFITYYDASSKLQSELKNINHKSSISSDQTTLNLISNTSIDSVSVKYNGISYLKNIKFSNTSEIEATNKSNNIVIRKNESILNEFLISMEGNIMQMENNTMDLNLHIYSPGSTFKELFSILPETYTSEYINVVTSGQYNFDITLNGKYNSENEIYPNFTVICKIQDGKVKYPSKPVELENVQLNLLVKNEDPKLNTMQMHIMPLTCTFNREPIELELKAINLKSNADVSGKIKGLIALQSLHDFISLDKGTSLAGIIKANIDFAFRQSDIENSQIEKIKFNGFVSLQDIKYKTQGTPPVQISSAYMSIAPSLVELQNSKIIIGSSDLEIKGKLENPLAFISDTRKCKGAFVANSSKMNLNEIMNDNQDPTKNGIVTPMISEVPDIIKSLDCNINMSCGELIYSTYILKQTKGQINFGYDYISILDAKSIINDNPMVVNVNIKQIFNYVYKNQAISGNIQVKGKKLDLDQLMAVPEGMIVEQTQGGTETSAITVPENIFLDIDFGFNEIKYGKILLNECKGQLAIQDGVLEFHDLNSQTMGGKMALNGVYKSRLGSKPSFDLKYDLSKIKFSELFKSVEAIKLIAPLAQYIEGIFNTSFVCQGDLDSGMMPDLSTLNLDGLIETLDGAVKGFKPLEEIGNKMDIQMLKSLNLKNTKNWIHIDDGKVSIKEFTKRIEDIDVKVDGVHSISGPMAYKVVLRIPQAKLNAMSSMLGADKGISFLTNLASKNGFEIKKGSHVNVLINMNGKLLSPDISYKLLGSDGNDLKDNVTETAKDVVVKVKDSVKARSEQELNIVKQKALEEAKRLEDSLRSAAQKKANEMKDKAIDELAKKSGVDSVLLKKSGEVLGKGSEKILKEGGKGQVDSIKSKIKEWNPFKKK